MARTKLSVSLRKSTAKSGIKGKSISKQVQAQSVAGDEPIPVKPDSPLYRSYLIKYYNWANIMFDAQELKDMFIEYAKKIDLDISDIEQMPKGFFHSLGNTAYLYNKGYSVSEEVDASFNNSLEYVRKKAVSMEEEKKKFQIEEPLKVPKHLEEYWDMYISIDKSITEKTISAEFLTELFTTNKPAIRAAKMIQEHYKESLDDWSSETGDRTYKKNVKDYIQSYILVCNQLEKYVTNLENTKVAERKPRVRKAKPATKLVEKLVYLKEDTKLGISSVPPESIVGAKALMIFNTKTRKFGIFYAEKESGLTVKGTTLLDFDENKSTCKTLRKPEDMLTKLTGSTIKRTEKLFSEIKAVETKLKGRISSDILLLKIIK